MIDLTSDFGRAVERHLKEEYVIWLTTVDSQLRPQPRPVWFLWEDDSILVFSQPKAFKVRHIEKHPTTLVHDLLGARGASASPALVLVTLDPRRDTPPRLAAIMEQWRLSPGDFLLGGDVADVEATVAGWGIPWQRDTLTGEIHHGTQLFVVSAGGRLEWVVSGGDAREAVELAATYSPPLPSRTPST